MPTVITECRTPIRGCPLTGATGATYSVIARRDQSVTRYYHQWDLIGHSVQQINHRSVLSSDQIHAIDMDKTLNLHV